MSSAEEYTKKQIGAEFLTTDTPEDIEKFFKERNENFDVVQKPAHYNQGGVECIDAIAAALGDKFPAYAQGNVMKYTWRYEHKNGIQDLKKAQWYLNKMIEFLEDK